jgi:pimeloyl-ACP methyl ester carboxylesterase
LKPEGKLVVFVHGFNGDALATWGNFWTFWPKTLGGWDLAFFGYPAFKLSRSPRKLISQPTFTIDSHADTLNKFLRAMDDSPSCMINEGIRPLIELDSNYEREHNFQYSQIVLVAHSMGAVVCRRASILFKNQAWVTKSRLALFAPAHKGATPLILLNGLTNIRSGPLIAAALKYRVPELKKLEENGPYLKELEKDTKTAIKKGQQGPFIADPLIWSVPENYVVNDFFADDSKNSQSGAEPVPNKPHSEVCKPKRYPNEYMLPIERIKALLESLP